VFKEKIRIPATAPIASRGQLNKFLIFKTWESMNLRDNLMQENSVLCKALCPPLVNSNLML